VYEFVGTAQCFQITTCTLWFVHGCYEHRGSCAVIVLLCKGNIVLWVYEFVGTTLPNIFKLPLTPCGLFVAAMSTGATWTIVS
jgi:hypothetical protein